MKCNVHLYLPWSVIAELGASADPRLSNVKSNRPGVLAASVETLDGGCVLYRLFATVEMSGRPIESEELHEEKETDCT
jgi:hypothetical protein